MDYCFFFFSPHLLVLEEETRYVGQRPCTRGRQPPRRALSHHSVVLYRGFFYILFYFFKSPIRIFFFTLLPISTTALLLHLCPPSLSAGRWIYMGYISLALMAETGASFLQRFPFDLLGFLGRNLFLIPFSFSFSVFCRPKPNNFYHWKAKCTYRCFAAATADGQNHDKSQKRNDNQLENRGVSASRETTNKNKKEMDRSDESRSLVPHWPAKLFIKRKETRAAVSKARTQFF